jgi:ribosomal protein L32
MTDQSLDALREELEHKLASCVFVQENENRMFPEAAIDRPVEDEVFLKRLLAALPREPPWRTMDSAPKGVKILAGYRNGLGNWRTILATYYPAGTLEASDFADTDDEWAPEGWYEEGEAYCENLQPVEQIPTRWMPAPSEPNTRAAVPDGPREPRKNADGLLGCPFCGGVRAKTHPIRDGQQVGCPDCGAQGAPEFHGPLSMLRADLRAIKSWNTRAAVPEDRAAGKCFECGEQLVPTIICVKCATSAPEARGGLIERDADVLALAMRAENWLANGVIKEVLAPYEIKMLTEVLSALKARVCAALSPRPDGEPKAGPESECPKCGTLFLPHHHFVRCAAGSCPMRSAKDNRSLADGALKGEPEAGQEVKRG